MKFMIFVLPTVPGTLEDRRNLRPIGRNNERYQQMLDELRQLVVLRQQYHATGAPMDGSAIDQHNRDVYEEESKDAA